LGNWENSKRIEKSQKDFLKRKRKKDFIKMLYCIDERCPQNMNKRNKVNLMRTRGENTGLNIENI